MIHFIRNLLTGTDNQSWELSRVAWALGVLAMIAYQGVAIWVKGQAFSPVEFGTGFGAILAAGGFGTAQKDRANPANALMTVTDGDRSVAGPANQVVS
jgi:hypothetical protein